jgi:hypothetical protein
MATVTPNYEFILPDKSDRINVDTLNGNFTSIDTILGTQADAIDSITPQLATADIDSAALADFYEGTKSGTFDADVLGSAAIGVVRAYRVGATDAMQIVETVDGSRYTRHYTSSAWTNWI